MAGIIRGAWSKRVQPPKPLDAGPLGQQTTRTGGPQPVPKPATIKQVAPAISDPSGAFNKPLLVSNAGERAISDPHVEFRQPTITDGSARTITDPIDGVRPQPTITDGSAPGSGGFGPTPGTGPATGTTPGATQRLTAEEQAELQRRQTPADSDGGTRTGNRPGSTETDIAPGGPGWNSESQEDEVARLNREARQQLIDGGFDPDEQVGLASRTSTSTSAGGVVGADGRRYADRNAAPRAATGGAFNPGAGQWGEFQPTGDRFTGTRNGKNYFRGVLIPAEGLDQGGIGASNFLRHHIPILLSQLRQGDPERAGLEAELARLGGPLATTNMTPGSDQSVYTNTAPPGGNPPGGPGFTGRRPGDIPGGPGFGGAGPIGGGPSTRRRPDGTVIPPPGSSTPRQPGDVATWTPGEGIIDQIAGVDPERIEGTGYTTTQVPGTVQATANGTTADGYTATNAPDAVGYTAEGYDAEKSNENLSQATDRIIGADSPLMQRERAQAAKAANKRGLLNSSMGVEAGEAAVLDKAVTIGQGDIQNAQFNAQSANEARAFLANAKNAAAQFMSAETNTTGRFNAQQANEASKFTAEASNQAKQFTAAAQNTASMFNAGEANKAALFAVEQANLASKYAAEMENAARTFNATAFNTAQQRYADAMNAALAAQQDATNLSRRDAAAATNSARENAARIEGDRGRLEMQLAAQLEQLGMTLDQRDAESIRGISANMFGSFQAGLNSILQAEMEPDSRQNAISNYMAVWAGSGYLPFDIDLGAFPPAGNTTTGTPPPGTTTRPGTPPPPGTTPGGNPIGRGTGNPLNVSR